ncbi:hypothetical protein AXF42_Ash010971 [Apostasia shenzhenica]|uniref:Uncharacterized protein n=1 Tax=Apostasia shenzhenica TaxID=1088818 RepID=A0A2H9ZQR1_9ASPA|nr:hypothetical protein AXF42_Ash010971 [Apostasia shenzhenica]
MTRKSKPRKRKITYHSPSSQEPKPPTPKEESNGDLSKYSFFSPVEPSAPNTFLIPETHTANRTEGKNKVKLGAEQTVKMRTMHMELENEFQAILFLYMGLHSHLHLQPILLFVLWLIIPLLLLILLLLNY